MLVEFIGRRAISKAALMGMCENAETRGSAGGDFAVPEQVLY